MAFLAMAYGSYIRENVYIGVRNYHKSFCCSTKNSSIILVFNLLNWCEELILRYHYCLRHKANLIKHTEKGAMVFKLGVTF